MMTIVMKILLVNVIVVVGVVKGQQTQQQAIPARVRGTFNHVRLGTCLSITASIRQATATIDESQCMVTKLSDLQTTNLQPVIRYVPVTTDGAAGTTTTEQEVEVSFGALVVNGSLDVSSLFLEDVATTTTNTTMENATNEEYIYVDESNGTTTTTTASKLSLSYSCPPDGYNGFFLAFGSFCEVSDSTQLWITFTDYNGDVNDNATSSRLLKDIRVILSYEFPEVETLRDNEPPFGTVWMNFPSGINLTDQGANDDRLLVICNTPDTAAAEDDFTCPDPPAISGLNTKLNTQSFGYFGTDLLPKGLVIPGYWNQNDDHKLLSGITSPSGSGGLQDFYFNENGFYLHDYPGPPGSPFDTGLNETCIFLSFCDYDCEVYNYDARFFDDLGTWKVTWKLDQEFFGVDDYQPTVRAYLGSAIDGVGIFPCLMYTDVDQQAFLGLDKIGSAVADQQPSYAYYWYINYTVGAPPDDILLPPDICLPPPPALVEIDNNATSSMNSSSSANEDDGVFIDDSNMTNSSLPPVSASAEPSVESSTDAPSAESTEDSSQQGDEQAQENDDDRATPPLNVTTSSAAAAASLFQGLFWLYHLMLVLV